jgi:hypothetical protein
MKAMMMLGVSVLVSTMAYAALAQPPATQPAYEPLIAQLGDDNPHLRDAAVRELRKAGREALPLLRDAANSSNLQVRESAEMLVAEAEGKRIPTTGHQASARQALSPADALELQALAMPQGRIIVRGGNLVLNNVRLNNMPGQMQLQVIRNGQFTRDMTINENGRKIQIHEDNNGIKMQVGEGAEAKEYAARNADELKEKEPEAFKLYEKYAQNGAGRLNIRVEPPLVR